MKIGIFGGAFSPVTKGHIKLANYLVNKKTVDEVWLTPCNSNFYLKNLEAGEHRIKMLELAEKHDKVKVCDFEIRNDLDKSTYEIMNLLKKEYPQDDLYFVLGLDTAQKMRSWGNGLQVMNEMKCIVIPRAGTSESDVWYKNYPHIYEGNYMSDSISSTEVKKLLSQGVNLDNHLDSAVFDYIIQHNLYKEHWNANIGAQNRS